MKNYLAATALVACVCPTVLAQVDPVYSSITSNVSLSLTGGNGSDAEEVIDDQGAMIDPLIADAVAGFSNANGTFDGSVNGYAPRLNASSGAFFAGSSFMGSDSGLPGAMGSFAHTLSSVYEYQFIIDGEGEIEIDGLLGNSGTSFRSFVRLSMSSESVVGGGFVGFFFDENIIDTSATGSEFFSRSIPLTAPSGSYRMRILLSHSGVGQRDQVEVAASLVSNFSISVIDPCPADLTGDGLVDFFDVSAFLTAFNSLDPIADFTDDGVFDFFDVSAFLSAYGSGCP
ncbi:MAG: hypothetical protein JJ916_00245 [Phycisphaerales bacterium]|nr:hypothetical protein [Phycisphaerales bacterium]